jgi:hypothetical protein
MYRGGFSFGLWLGEEEEKGEEKIRRGDGVVGVVQGKRSARGRVHAREVEVGSGVDSDRKRRARFLRA